METYHKTTPHSDKGAFTPRTSARGQVPVVRVDRQPVDVAVGLEVHDGLGLRGSGVEHTALVPERLVQQRRRVRLFDPAAGAGVGDGGCAQAADGAMVFFGGNRQAEQ